MFETLSDKLQRVFKNLRGEGKLTELHLDEALKEIRMALLEADVNFKVVKQFTDAVKAKALSPEVMQSLSPGQQVVKIVRTSLSKCWAVQMCASTLRRNRRRSSCWSACKVPVRQPPRKTFKVAPKGWSPAVARFG
jgi:signal recognition particle GTPase